MEVYIYFLIIVLIGIVQLEQESNDLSIFKTIIIGAC